MTSAVKRKPGRPRVLDQPSADVHLRLRPEEYDRAHAVAKSRRESIQDVIRRSLRQFLRDDRSGPR